MKKLGLSLSILLASFLLMLALIWLRGGYVTILRLGGLPLSMLVYAVVFFSMTLLCLKWCSKTLPAWLIIVIIIVGLLPVDIYTRLIRPDAFIMTLLFSLPDLICRITAVLVAWLVFAIDSKYVKAGITVLFFAASLWCSYFGFRIYVEKITTIKTDTVQTIEAE